jgi:hypothetical protein
MDYMYTTYSYYIWIHNHADRVYGRRTHCAARDPRTVGSMRGRRLCLVAQVAAV